MANEKEIKRFVVNGAKIETYEVTEYCDQDQNRTRTINITMTSGMKVYLSNLNSTEKELNDSLDDAVLNSKLFVTEGMNFFSSVKK